MKGGKSAMSILTGIITGHLGNDAELRYSQNGKAIVSFNVAVSQSQKVGEDWQNTTEWVRCTVFNRETVGQYLLKGTKVTCTGRLSLNRFTKRDGSWDAQLQLIVSDIDWVKAAPKTSPGIPDDNDELPF